MTRRAVVLAALVAALGLGASMHVGAQSAAPQVGPTYSKDVAPILYKNCTGCHRPGEIGPMSLLSYSNVRPWTKAIASRVEAGTMPPWHADPSTGEFLNDRRLDPKDKATLLAWIANGALEGDPKDLPPAPHYADGWTIGQPDAVVKMGEDYPIPATGTIPYEYFEVPTNFTEDRWVTAYEVRPGSRANVHHVIVYTRQPAPPQRPQAQAGQPARPRPQPLFSFPDGQMEIFIDTFKTATASIAGKPSFLFMLDLEVNPGDPNPPREDDGIAMVRNLQARGINPIIYCGKDFWSRSFPELGACPHYLAAYNDHPSSAIPWRIPGADVYGWDMWQYTDGRTAGAVRQAPSGRAERYGPQLLQPQETPGRL